MGNCQAADAAAVVIQHPSSGRTELAYWSLPAGEVMAANPGHYVAAVITAPHTASSEGAAAAAAPPVKHLKLLRPDDTLLLGRVYRLVSFEEVLKEFATKRHVKLSRVMVKAKDEVATTKPAKPRRRRGSSGAGAGGDSGVQREESHRSLAKIMRQSVEEDKEAAATAGPASGPVPKPGANDGNGVAASEPDVVDDDDCDLESLLPPGVALGRRLGRQWRPALQSIAEGRD
ncbi:hypothetical protein D1007_10575 [Hordeum vulgare]|nr:hypothetical protein D1007_10575 [Hordeum vulgare]